MSVTFAKYLLWALLCVPVVYLSVYFLLRLLRDRSMLKRHDHFLELEKERQLLEERENTRRRQLFDRRYRDYLDSKYGDGHNL